MSRNSRAGWPPVLQPTGAPCEVVQCAFIPMIGREEQQHASHTLAACCCSSRPIIGMNAHWTTLTWRARWLEHGWPSGARVSRHPTAGSHHSYRMDSAKRRFRANCIVEVFFNDCQASNQCAQRGDRDDREVRDGKNIWKCLHAGLHCIPRGTGIVRGSPD